MITLNATYQQTKRVVDTVAATYQTLLTIDHSVGQSDIVGTYNCMVENDRGKSSMTIGEWNLCTLALCFFFLFFFLEEGGLNHCNSFSHYGVSLTLKERKKSEDRRYSHFSDLPVLYILYGNLCNLNQFIQLKLKLFY